MTELNPLFFSDPFIRPSSPFIPPSLIPAPLKPELEPNTPVIPQSQPSDGKPQIVQNLLDLDNPSVIVYRNSTPTSVCKGPDIKIPILNLEIKNASNESEFSVNCVSTYPTHAPYAPIADRFEIRFFKDSFILTLTDGCGLHPSSRLAPKAAIEGFWDYLSPKLKEDPDRFDIHKLGNYFKSALKAAHFNIYWDAFSRSQEGFASLKNNVCEVLNNIDEGSDYECLTKVLKLRKSNLLQEVELIKKALEGDLEARKDLVKKNLASKFYEDYAGATTFMCSALLKSSGAEDFPYYLLTLNLGDGQCFVMRSGTLMEMTKDTRADMSNVRDPGGKIGLCTPHPLKMDPRNLQFSLTPCQSDDLLLFMTDGVLDNINPERLGICPQGQNTPYWVQEKIKEAGQITTEELSELLKLLDFEEMTWKQVPLKKANGAKKLFVNHFLELLAQKGDTPEESNQNIIDFCTQITEGHRDKSSSFYEEPLGKPDHTTCLTYKVP